MCVTKKHFILLSCSALTLAAVSSTASADDYFSFDTIVVTASKSEQAQGKADSSVDVIKDESIKKNIVTSVDDLFRFTPSVTVSGSGNRGESPLNIRGITGNRVLTNVDGVRQPKNLGFGFLESSRHFVDPNTLKQVEIIPGPASSLYGSDALGGVVSYLTKNPEDVLRDEQDTFAGVLSTRFDGSSETFNKSVTLAGRKGSAESLLILTHQDGHEVENTGEVGGTGDTREKADPQDNEDISVLAKLALDMGSNKKLKLTAQHNKTKEDTEALSNSLLETVYKDEKRLDRLSAELAVNTGTSVFDNYTLKADWQKSDTDQLATYLSRGFPSSYDSDYTEETKTLKLDFEKVLGSHHLHNIHYGLSADQSQFEQWRNSARSGIGRGMPVSESTSYAVYAMDEIKLGDSKWKITPGLRYDKYTIDPQPDADYLATNPADGNPSKSTESKASFKLGATYDLNNNNSFFGHFSQGFKAPDMDQLYESFDRPGAYSGIANPNLKPESVDSFELGYRLGTDKTNLEIVAFHNEYEDFIEQVNLGAEAAYPFGVFQNQNLTGVKTRGVEVKANVKLTDAVKLRGAIASTKGDYQKSGETKPLNSISPLHGVVALGYDAPSERWGGELSLVSSAGKKEKDVDDPSATFLSAGYGVVDLTSYWKPTKNLTLNVGVFNVADKQYWEWETARDLSDTQRNRSEPGRHLKVGMSWDF